MAQAFRHSPPIAGVRSSRLNRSTWVSWWTKVVLGRGSSRFPLLQISFHHLYTLIRFISFYFISSAPVMLRQAWSVGILVNFFLSFSLYLFIYFPHVGLTTQMPMCQMPVGGATDCGPEHYCCLLFNDGHVLQLCSETVAICGQMIYGLYDI